MDQQFIIHFTFFFIGFTIGCIIIHWCNRYQNINFSHERIRWAQDQENKQKKLEKIQYDLQCAQQKLYQLSIVLKNTEVKLKKMESCRHQNKELNIELKKQLEKNNVQAVQLGEVTVRLEEIRSSNEEKQKLLIDSEQRLSAQFENLANRIFENNNRRVNEQHQQSLNNILIPLREQLDDFRRQINNNSSQEARERYSLLHEIQKMQKLNSQMAQETLNLTKALKGNNKIQGNWGEFVLAKVLESAGLREGYEYEKQVSITLDAQNNKMQPDVIIHLPQGKDVIIDSKMTLVFYERYFNTEDEVLRERAFQDHIASIRNHIRILAKKDYQQLPGVRCLDYVLMFIAIEPAFSLTIDRQPELINEALQKNIMLVSPTTLLVALRTINNLWRYENQNRNAQLIAEHASRFYDKMRLFVDDMSSIGNNLDKAQQSYNLAMKKLVKGRSNLISQTEVFRSLGVEVKRPINSDVILQTKD